MAWTILTEASAGAPALLSVNGSLNNVLRWALPLLGWAVEFGPTGNASVFRAADGNRHRLNVRHDSAVSGNAGLAYVRGAHTATSATAIGQPFPTAAQVPNNASVWKAGTEDAPATPTPYVIAGNERFFHMLVYSPTYGWDWVFFGDVPSDYATGYETAVRVRYTPGSPYGVGGMASPLYPVPQGSNLEYWARGINATTVSTMGNTDGPGYGTAVGRVVNTPPMRGGYLNRVMREKIALTDTGSTTATVNVLAVSKRGWLPNVWAPVHVSIGAMADGDTFTDSAYNAAASFRVFNSNEGTVILETTDTWVKP